MARTLLFRSLNKILSDSIQEEPFWAKVKINRRSSLEIGGFVSMAAYLKACHTMGPERSQSFAPGLKPSEVVIVGGGAAGLAAAYYLKKAGVASRVYEANERLGGRIFTQEEFNGDGMFCERGGELIDTGHKHIQDLMNELGLELELLPDSSRLLDAYFFENEWRSAEELIEAFRPLAKRIAKDAEDFLVKDEFVMPTFENPISSQIKQLDNTSLKAYLDAAIESPEWVRELIRIAYVGEYGLEAEEQSAINLLSFIGTEIKEGFKLFGESDELYRIKGGSSRLIDKLEERLSGQVSANHVLKSIGEGSQGRLQLLFEDLKERGDRRVVEVQSSTVIMALPFTVLRSIKGIDKIGIRSRKLTAIRELGYGTNCKLMLGFRERYWRTESTDFPACEGSVVTDLRFQGGWDSSRKQSGQSGIFTNFMGGRYAETFSPAKVSAAVADLNKLFPGVSSLRDGNMALQIWAGVETAKGSYVCPKPGQYTSLGGVSGTQECRGRLHFAGEHTSEESAGFMNGAVESGLRVAIEYLRGKNGDQAVSQ